VYLTRPADATSRIRTEEELEAFLSHFPLQETWIWLFDCREYSYSEMMSLPIAVSLAKKIQSRHLDRLVHIYILNGSWLFRFALGIVGGLLGSRISLLDSVLSL